MEEAAIVDRELAQLVLPAREPAPAPRVVGPGRRERGYLDQLAQLAAALADAEGRGQELEQRALASRAALETSQRVEHGCQRRIDRLESRLEERTQALLASERQHKRLALALGGMQRENELLRRELALLLPAPGAQPPEPPGQPGRPGRPERSGTASAPGFWRRLFRRAR